MDNGEVVVKKKARVRKQNLQTGNIIDPWTEDEIVAIVKSINEYIDSVEIPIIKEWMFKNDVSVRKFDKHRFELVKRGDYRVEDAFDRLLNKKEYILEYMALYNLVNYKMAMFSLKQLGWTDKQEVKADINTDMRIQVKFK